MVEVNYKRKSMDNNTSNLGEEEINMDIPEDLVSRIRSGKCIAFVGHQLSEFAGLPSWSKMLFQTWDWLEKRIGPLRERKELESLIPDSMVTAVSRTQKLLHTKRLFNECMTEIYKSYYDLNPTGIHKLIARLPFASVFTTNYDTLLESAYSHIQGTSPPCYTYQDTSNVSRLISKNQFCMLKLLGTMEQIDTILFGQEDIKSSFRRTDYSDFLKNILANMTILFIGCNPVDPDQIVFLGEIYRNIIPAVAEKHYAFVSDEEASNFDKQWSADSSINNYLRIITYKHTDSNYEQIQQFLTGLSERVTESQEANMDGKVVITKSIENQGNPKDNEFQSQTTVQNAHELIGTMKKDKPKELVIFLGAGASMPFGIPGMSEFVDSLDCAIMSGKISIKDDERELWHNLLMESGEKDLEWILSTLNGLSERNLRSRIRLLDLPFDEGKLEQIQTKAKKLKTKIEEYIKEKCLLPQERRDEAIKYYNSFFEELLNARGYHPKIFTTNYDNVIESSNEERNLFLDPNIDTHRPKIALVNGFSSSKVSRSRIWGPRIFEAKIIEDCIPQYFFKLHGSIDWYATSSDILEIPAIAPSMKLPSGKQAGSLLIYPVEEKRIFSSPFTELFYQFRSTLLYEARILLVIGYSFRDDIFQNLFKEALERNKDLRIFVANKDRNQIAKVQKEFGENRVVPIAEEFGSGDFIPSLFNKLWEETKGTIIYQAEHLPKNGPAQIVEDPGATNGIAVELKALATDNGTFSYGAIYGPYRPLPERGKYNVTYRARMMPRTQLPESKEPIARIDISPAPDVRKNYSNRKYPEIHLNGSNFQNSYKYLDFSTELEYDDEPSMEYRIQSVGAFSIRVDRISIQKCI